MFKTQVSRGFRGSGRRCLLRDATCVLPSILASLLATPLTIRSAAAGSTIALWDTGTAFADAIDLTQRAGWERVPTDLLALEREPAKARSDPGYYGRAYAFKGDAVVENRGLTAVFWASRGRVVLYATSDTPLPGEASSPGTRSDRRVVEIMPLNSSPAGVRLTQCHLRHHGGDQVVIEVGFGTAGGVERLATFSFDKTAIVEVRPGAKMEGFSLVSPLAYGVVPSFLVDDLILSPAAPLATTLHLPSESIFLGLLEGEAGILTLTWPKGKQQLQLKLGNGPAGNRAFESIEFRPAGRSFYLAASQAPGLWHREELKPAYLEKTIALPWERPFPARWRTQLYEERGRTTYAFRDGPGQIWRGMAGMYDYPAWFEGDRAFLRLSKKVPPKGDALIYFLEGQDTPASVLTPADMLKATLGRAECEALIDLAGRQLRTHHRRGALGARRACTCGCTDAIQAVFSAGEEVEQQTYISGAVDDMVYFVEQHVRRIAEYQTFATNLLELFEARGRTAPDLKAYLDSLREVARQIPQECQAQQANMKSPEFAAQLARQTVALAARKDPNNPAAFKKLLDAWRGMGGAQDSVVASCHLTARKLFQEAAQGCLDQPAAVELAQEIRERCRQVLRNSDGYEIWPNY